MAAYSAPDASFPAALGLKSSWLPDSGSTTPTIPMLLQAPEYTNIVAPPIRMAPPAGSVGSEMDMAVLSSASRESLAGAMLHMSYGVPATLRGAVGGGSREDGGVERLANSTMFPSPAGRVQYSSRLVAAARSHDRLSGSTLGSVHLTRLEPQRVLSVDDDDADYDDMRDEDGAGLLMSPPVRPCDADVSMRADSDCDDGCVHVRINSRPMIITYTPKTAMTESDAESVCSTPDHSATDAYSDAESPGGVPTPSTLQQLAMDRETVAPSSLRISALRANEDARMLGVSGEDGGIASLRIGVGSRAEAYTPGGGRPANLTLSLRSAAPPPQNLTEAEAAYQASMTVSPYRCGARVGPKARPRMHSSSEDSGEEEGRRRSRRRPAEGYAGMRGAGHATGVAPGSCSDGSDSDRRSDGVGKRDRARREAYDGHRVEDARATKSPREATPGGATWALANAAASRDAVVVVDVTAYASMTTAMAGGLPMQNHDLTEDASINAPP